mgnify:CR=1 FL=1
MVFRGVEQQLQRRQAAPAGEAGLGEQPPRDVVDAMAAALHEAGIRLIVDIVPNHSSNRHRWFREALADRGITTCIPSKSNRKTPIEYDRTLYRQRHRIKNMFGRMKDWRRIHTRYDRCANTFMSASASPPPFSHDPDQ